MAERDSCINNMKLLSVSDSENVSRQPDPCISPIGPSHIKRTGRRLESAKWPQYKATNGCHALMSPYRGSRPLIHHQAQLVSR
ncbi:hypothetical protein J6590_012490 [Homalodisca vitripennis]|nr:hypothetical protein J6590_012490 [Homalodisca vitripennis]